MQKMVGHQKGHISNFLLLIRKKKGDYIGYVFLAPFAILFFTFTILPIISSIVLSLTNYNILQAPKFIGLTNYKLLLLDDDVFLTALKNTLIFSLVTGPLGYILSFMFAWIINRMTFSRAFALAFYAPSLTSGIAMSAVWLYIFSSDQYGLINNILLQFGFIDAPILWTQDPKTILPVVIFVSIWMSMGTGFLVFLAGFKNVPMELYEAGKIDGIKNRFEELVYITIPSMKGQLLFGAINAIVASFGVYDISVAIAGMPSPEYAGHTVVAHLYDYAFIRFQMGYASSIAVVLFIITFVLGQICMKIFKSDD